MFKQTSDSVVRLGHSLWMSAMYSIKSKKNIQYISSKLETTLDKFDFCTIKKDNKIFVIKVGKNDIEKEYTISDILIDIELAILKLKIEKDFK